MDVKEILDRLKEGNARFMADDLEHPNQDSAARTKWKDTQEPWAIVLSCADSRVIPEAVFDTGISDLFVCRVAGNIANTETIASIEYAVAHLKTKVIIVLGHEKCGAVGAAIAGGDNGYNLNMLLAHITPAIAQGGDTPTIIKNNARNAAGELTSRSGIISGADVTIVPAYYHLESGKVDFLD